MLALAIAATVFALAAGALIFWIGGYFHHPGRSTPRLALIWAIASFPLTWISTFLNVALAAAASAALDGRRLTLRQALGVSTGRLGQITAWSLLVTVVGVVVRELLSRVPWGGKLLSFLAGTAWSLATLFAIPILALEGCSALKCAQRSGRLFKERWGEGVSGNLIIAAWTVVVSIPAGVLLAIGVNLHRRHPAQGVLLLAIGLVLFMTVVAFAGAARQVFAVALFRYARDGRALGGFFEPELKQPLTPKRRGLWRR